MREGNSLTVGPMGNQFFFANGVKIILIQFSLRILFGTNFFLFFLMSFIYIYIYMFYHIHFSLDNGRNETNRTIKFFKILKSVLAL